MRGDEVKNIFHWVEIRTRDLEKAKEFYESLFDWKITGEENKDFSYWIIDTGGFPRGGMWRMPKDKPLGVITYVLVDNIDATLEKVEKLGGKVVLSKRSSNGGAYAVFADPEGNMLGLWEASKKP